MSANVLYLTSLQKPGLYSFAAANVRNLRRLELASRPHRLGALRLTRMTRTYVAGGSQESAGTGLGPAP